MKYLNEINQVLAGRNIHQVDSQEIKKEVYALTGNPILEYYWTMTHNDRINEISKRYREIVNEVDRNIFALRKETINPATGLTGDEQKSAEKANEDKTRIDKEAALEAYKISEANKPYGKYAYYANLTEEEKGKVKYQGVCGFGRKTYSAEERAEHESKYIVPRPKRVINLKLKDNQNIVKNKANLRLDEANEINETWWQEVYANNARN